jgi:hypothetical protein
MSATKKLSAATLMTVGGEGVSIAKSLGRRSGMLTAKHDVAKTTQRMQAAWHKRLLLLIEKGEVRWYFFGGRGWWRIC